MSARTCGVCGERAALYICQNCGSSICPICRVGWSCRRCATGQESARQPIMVGSGSLLTVAIAAMLVGFVLVILGSGSLTGSGGCFFWPLPLVVGFGFGLGEASTFAAFSALALVVVTLAFWFRSLRRGRVPS